MSETKSVIASSPETLSNGLSPELLQIAESPEFVEWFGDWRHPDAETPVSKIRSSVTGQPSVYYHGTNREFEEFHHPSERSGMSNFDMEHDYEGIYLADNTESVHEYADPLGAHFNGRLGLIGNNFNAKTYKEAFDVWNEFLDSARQRDGRVIIEERDSQIAPEDAVDAYESKKINFSSTVKFDGKVLGWYGELLQELGGQFPQPDDELESYHSFFPEVEAKLASLKEKDNIEILMPKRAKPRVIPVFVKSLNPLPKPSTNGFLGIDAAFAQGFREIEAQPEEAYDSIVVDSKTNGNLIAVFSPDQLWQIHGKAA